MSDTSFSAFAAGLGSRVGRLLNRAPVVPLVRMHGVISAEQRPGRINIATYAPVLERAFAVKSAPAVALVVNSPGGSAVQSRLVAKRIRDLAAEHEKKVLVFVEDVAASGGYFIATAGDEIIADPSSLVGSIGVIMAGFGFEEAIRKLGISRRVYTAGRNKSTLDPFLPEKEEDVERLKSAELAIHQVFIDYVKARRGSKLTAEDDKLFTGEWWTATRGLELGLIDALGDMHEVLKTRFGEKVRIKSFGPKRPLLQVPRVGLSIDNAGAGLGAEVMAALEDRLFWSRFGL
jgi:signal peptide peptidase SppA